MWTGHLSRFARGYSPGPYLQKVNAILHQEPYATIVYHIYWSIFLLIIPPVVGFALLWKLLFELIMQYISTIKQLPPPPATIGGFLRHKIEPKQLVNTELAVMITGCDTGFGKELVFRLAAEGFVVFAGCLEKESLKNFAAEPLIKPLVMDVTKQQDIDHAYEMVQQWLKESTFDEKEEEESNKKKTTKRYFHALVNNAGIGRLGLVDWCDLSFYEVCMEVNCYALIRTTKAFLPILKQQAIDKSYTDAQIVNNISVAGLLSAGGFGGSPYEVSKHAAEAFTDGLRLEMKMFGIKVTAVNPSFHGTPLTDKTLVEEKTRKQLWDTLSPTLKEEYGQEYFESFVEHVTTSMSMAKWDFKVVIDSMVESIQSSDPPAQLVIGMDAKFGMLFLRMLPQWCRHFIVQTLMPKQMPAMLSKSGKSG